MSQPDALTRVVASLNEAALDDTHWPATSALIDDACMIEGNCLIHGSGQTDDDIRVHFSKVYYRGERNREFEDEYIDVYHPIDERISRFRRLPDCEVVHTRDLFTEAELKTSPTYNEFLPRAHFQNSLSVRLDGPHGTRIAWATAHPLGGDGWSSAQVGTIERILPHLRQYVSVRQTLIDARALGTSLAGLLDNGGCGVIQLDRRGRIVETNDSAGNLLKRSDGLFDRGGYLRAWSPSDDADLQGLLEGALPRSGRQGVSGSMTVRRPSVSPRLALHISPLGDGQMDFRPSRVAALVLVVDPLSRARIDPVLVSESLGLTPAQGQVAALLAEGKTIREIAAATGRRESTIRWHLHHICHKHGISRQVELVRLVLSLAAVLRS